MKRPAVGPKPTELLTADDKSPSGRYDISRQTEVMTVSIGWMDAV